MKSSMTQAAHGGMIILHAKIPSRYAGQIMTYENQIINILNFT